MRDVIDALLTIRVACLDPVHLLIAKFRERLVSTLNHHTHVPNFLQVRVRCLQVGVSCKRLEVARHLRQQRQVPHPPLSRLPPAKYPGVVAYLEARTEPIVPCPDQQRVGPTQLIRIKY